MSWSPVTKSPIEVKGIVKAKLEHIGVEFLIIPSSFLWHPHIFYDITRWKEKKNPHSSTVVRGS